MIIGIIVFLISIVVLYFYLFSNKKIFNKKIFNKKINFTSKSKQIKNINKHLKIADASNNLHEVRMHARKAMKLINKYGLLKEYREIFKNR